MRSGSTFPEPGPVRGVALAVAIAWLVAAPPALPQPLFRSAADLVALPVTVLDQNQHYVTDLRQEDFRVFEEGVAQTVTLFAAGTTPLDLMLLIDTSGSMTSRLPIVRRAARRFVRALGPGDRAAVVLFDERVRIAQPLSHDRDNLEPAIDHTSPSGGTAFYEAVYISLRELARARRSASELRRQALVVLTDGEDTSTRNVSFDEILTLARTDSAIIYCVFPPEAIPTDYESPRRPRAMFDMKTLAENTGGRMFTPQWGDQLADVYAEIADELVRQYWLAFVPRAKTPGFKRVSVQVLTRPALKARTRSGYYAGGARP